jgi:hypothetical protein
VPSSFNTNTAASESSFTFLPNAVASTSSAAVSSSTYSASASRSAAPSSAPPLQPPAPLDGNIIISPDFSGDTSLWFSNTPAIDPSTTQPVLLLGNAVSLSATSLVQYYWGNYLSKNGPVPNPSTVLTQFLSNFFVGQTYTLAINYQALMPHQQSTSLSALASLVAMAITVAGVPARRARLV